jgi:hypothetical protein
MDAEDQPIAPSDDDSDAPVSFEDTSHAHDNGHLPEGMDESGDVRAQNVTLSQGGARDIVATTVSITQGGAAQVRAEHMNLSQGGVALARTDNLTVADGGSAFAVLSDHATVNEGGNVLVLIAGEVSGDARPLLDWRSALALGAGLVVAWRLVRRIL